jgi:hypothetical protein
VLRRNVEYCLQGIDVGVYIGNEQSAHGVQP